jgi:hypothetical protein
MKTSHRLYQLFKPHRGILSIAFILLACVGLCEALITSLVIPLFDNVLTANPTNTALSKVGIARYFLQLVQHSLAALPGSMVTQLATALVLLTPLKRVPAIRITRWDTSAEHLTEIRPGCLRTS